MKTLKQNALPKKYLEFLQDDEKYFIKNLKVNELTMDEEIKLNKIRAKAIVRKKNKVAPKNL